MSNIQHTVPSFERAGMPFAYDLLVRAIYLPVGGEAALRRAAIARLELAPGARILELGCGTGSFTRLLLERGARVTSIDGSARMIARARRRATGASFEQQDLRAFRAPTGLHFDVVFLAFVLHELPKQTRSELLARATRVLAPGGRVVVIDHAVPDGRGFARGWRSLLLALEPPSVRDVITLGYEAELRDVGLHMVDRAELARGTAKLLVAEKQAAHDHAPSAHTS